MNNNLLTFDYKRHIIQGEKIQLFYFPSTFQWNNAWRRSREKNDNPFFFNYGVFLLERQKIICQADSGCICYICLFCSSAAALVSVLWAAWSSCAALALVILTALLRNNFQIIVMAKFVCLASVLTNFHPHTYFSGIYNNFPLMSECELHLASLLFFQGLFFCQLYFRSHQLFLNTALVVSSQETFFCVKGHCVQLSEYCSSFHIVHIWPSVFVLESLSNIPVTPCLISCDGNSMQHGNGTAAQGQVWGMLGSAGWRTYGDIIDISAHPECCRQPLWVCLSLPRYQPAVRQR